MVHCGKYVVLGSQDDFSETISRSCLLGLCPGCGLLGHGLLGHGLLGARVVRALRAPESAMMPAARWPLPEGAATP